MANWLDKYEQGGLILKKKTKDNFGKKFNPNDVEASVGPGYVGLAYDTTGRNYSPAWGGQFQMGGSILGKTFLQPNNPKLPVGWNPKEKGYSTEYSTTVGKDGEYYLVPGFKHGKLVSDPEKEFYGTGELLGGPFKTIQSAQDFADRRHKYVEQGKPIPSPIKTYDYLKFAMGGSMPGAVGFTYARTAGSAPSNGKYAKKTKASAQNGQEMKFYQEGLDFTPKTISQNGLLMDRFKEEKLPSDATRVAAPIRPLTKKEQEENVKINKEYKKKNEELNKAIVADRKSRRETKGDVNVPGSFNIAEKLRLFPESVGGVGEMFDEYVNPAFMVGALSDALGESVAARSPEGVAATLAMTAGMGALGFDPLGSAMKAQRFSKGALNNLGYDVQTAGFSGQGPRPTVQPTNTELNAIRQQRLNNAVTQGSQSSRVPYQFPTDEELLAWNTAEANRYFRRPTQPTPPAPRTFELDAIEEYYQRNPRPATPRTPTEAELADLRRQYPVDREIQSSLQRGADDIFERAFGRRPQQRTLAPAPQPQPMSESLQRALRDIDMEPSARDLDFISNLDYISEDDLVAPAPRPSRGYEITDADMAAMNREPIEKQWEADKFRIGQGDQSGEFVTKHPEGHNIRESIEAYESGPTLRTYDIADAKSPSQHIQIRTRQEPGDPYVDVRDVSFFNRDPKSSSKQMNIVFSHLPKQARIEPISTSIHSQPLLNTRVAKLSSGQPGRIQIEPLSRMSSLNQITRSGFSPDAWYNEIIDQFPKLERTYKTINDYTGSELPMPFIRYKGNPMSFEDFKSPDFKRQVMEAGNLFDIDVMVNKYKTIKNWKNGGQIVDPMGQWAHPGKITTIPSNDITMKGVNYDVLGVSNTGDKKLMKPGKNYKFDGDYVTEYPKGGWLNKYK